MFQQNNHSWWSVGLLVFVLITAIYFYGVGFNLLFLWVASLGLSVAYIVRGPAQALQRLNDQPLFALICYFALLMLVVSHNGFSLSPDSSFAPSIIAACLPLLLLAVRVEDAHKTYAVAAWLIFVFAAMSVVEFVWSGQRAHTPLFDPNNYVTLLYLAWIPWILNRQVLPATPRRLLLSGGVTLVVCVAMFATTSRFAQIVVVGMVAVLTVQGLRLDWDKRNWLGTCAVMLLGFGVFTIFDPAGMDAAFEGAAAVEGTSAEGTRMLMLQSAWQAMNELGGWHGTGLFTFSLLYPQFRSVAEQVTTGQFVNNDYVQLAL